MTGNLLKSLIGIGVAALMAAGSVSPALAIPKLQLYAEGATYDPVDESWEFSISPGESANVWAIGNVAGPGGYSPITDAKLIVFVKELPGPDTYTLNYGTMGAGAGEYLVDGTFAFRDRIPSSAGAIPFISHDISIDGLPTLGDGGTFPPHGMHMSGFTHWLELTLGTFDTPDSEIMNFMGPVLDAASYKACTDTNVASTCPAQISVINVAAGSTGFTLMHFDLIGMKGNDGIFSPFSHDLTDPPRLPEPGTLLLFAFGLLSIVFIRRRRLCRV